MKTRSSLLQLLLLLVSANCLAQLCVERVASPTYPRLARIANIQGIVKVEVVKDRSGKVSVLKADGPKLLVENTKQNLTTWVLCHDGESPEKLTIAFSYSLTGPSQYEDGQDEVVFELPRKITIKSFPYSPQPSVRR